MADERSTVRAGRPMTSVVVSVRGWNRERLPELLGALGGQTVAAERMEVVVVDNDPPPAGRVGAIVHSRPWPFAVRVLREPRAGLSAGKNRGIAAARGEYVAFVDPDVLPDPEWLAALTDAIETEGVFAVGGRTTAVYPEGVRFLSPVLAECHGAVRWPSHRAPATWPFWVTGCNLVFHRETALKIGLLRTDLGRRGRWMGDCEDLEFLDRARQRGHTVLVEPSAHAVHPIYRDETTLAYYLRQGVGHGVSLARMHTSVHVEPAAIRAGRRDVVDALGRLIGAWGFTSPTDAVAGLRDLVRIAAYRAEKTRLRLTGRRLLPTRPMTDPTEEKHP
ncbi:glycosyltransferase [Actinocorallia sp. API 0066]|uniref:glycosyltransferase family 2 protein n=1 Tax=Actinocorallia sp. API 0066 TaxID=2896846 RepID=UPI001E470B21|nr:glycosyltransferase [Actinocorallia sp. API 0066]MCD0451471.1 glycosyltransferase [Actinocorallia sp. API 0066]